MDGNVQKTIVLPNIDRTEDEREGNAYLNFFYFLKFRNML